MSEELIGAVQCELALGPRSSLVQFSEKLGYELVDDNIDLSSVSRVLRVRVSSSTMLAHIDANAAEIARSGARIRGFDKHGVNPSIVKVAMASDILRNVSEHLINMYCSALCGENADSDVKRRIGYNIISLHGMPEPSLEFDVHVPAAPLVVAPDLSQIVLNDYKCDITDEIIDANYRKIIEDYRSYNVNSNEPIVPGDKVSFEWLTNVGGKKVMPLCYGEGTKQVIPVDHQNLALGLVGEMVGMRAGEEKDVEVSIPDDFKVKSFRNKRAVAHIKIVDVSKQGPVTEESFLRAEEPRVVREGLYRSLSAMSSAIKSGASIPGISKRDAARMSTPKGRDALLKEISSTATNQNADIDLDLIKRHILDAVKAEQIRLVNEMSHCLQIDDVKKKVIDMYGNVAIPQALLDKQLERDGSDADNPVALQKARDSVVRALITFAYSTKNDITVEESELNDALSRLFSGFGMAQSDAVRFVRQNPKFVEGVRVGIHYDKVAQHMCRCASKVEKVISYDDLKSAFAKLQEANKQQTENNNKASKINEETSATTTDERE